MSAATMSAADVLRRAKQVLIEQGWHQGDYVGPGGCVCAAGAIAAALLGRIPATENEADYVLYADETSDALTVFKEVIGDQDVGPWNDRAAGSVDRVLAAFDKAIAAAEAER